MLVCIDLFINACPRLLMPKGGFATFQSVHKLAKPSTRSPNFIFDIDHIYNLGNYKFILKLCNIKSIYYVSIPATYTE